MIDLMIKNIFENTNRIDNIANYINRMNKKHCLNIILLTSGLYITAKILKKHEDKINDLELQIKELKSKGE